ncbi:MAG: cytochrome ubiquinol oxidase subunit I, partial [Solirubrobacteraceae bacterium]
MVALIAGWVTTEVGRQPWVAYGGMRTWQAVTGQWPARWLRGAGARLPARGGRRDLDPAPPRPSAAG